MPAHDQRANRLIIEREINIHGELRWIAHPEGKNTRLLIVKYQQQLYALPLFCQHAHVSLLEAKLDDSGKVICPKHGLATDLKSNPNVFTVQRQDNCFISNRHGLIHVETVGPSRQELPLPNQETEKEEQTELDVLKTVNSALQKKVLSNLESMDSMLSEVEHKKVELEANNRHLLSVNQLIDSITNSMEEFLIVTDNQGRITRVNRYAESILNVKAKELIGSSPDNFLRDETLTEIIDQYPANNWDQRPYLYRAVYSNNGFEQEIRFRDPTGRHKDISNKFFLLKGTLIYSPEGKEEGLILSATDISVVKAKEKQKRQADIEKHLQLLQSTLSTISQGVAMFSGIGDLQTFNDAFTHNVNVDPDVLSQIPSYEVLFSGNKEILNVQTIPACQKLISNEYQWIQTFRDGRIIECESAPTPTGGFVVTTRDITQSQKNEEHIRLLSTTVEQSSSEVVITDTKGTIVYVNPMFTENTGYTAEEAIGQKSSIVQSGEMSSEFYKELWTTIKASNSWKGEILNRKKSGEKFWQSMSVTPIFDNNGVISHYLSLKADITKQKRAEKRLRYQAEHDLLTNLPNRSVLLHQLEDSIVEAKENHKASAVLFMDLDNFKDVNDTLGHLSGDILLKHVARRLELCSKPTDLVARLGGDEFAIVQNNITCLDDPKHLAEQIISSITQPFKVDDHLLHIGISIGITLLPSDGLDTGILLQNADMAMYEAKGVSGSHYHFFDLELQKSIQHKRTIETHLHNAIEHDELSLLFQPKIDIQSGMVVGAEALLRWHSKELGQVSPAEFIPIAERSGLIIKLGAWVLNNTLKHISAWSKVNIDAPKIAVNLSTIQLLDVNLITDIKEALAAHHVPAHKLELEITETAAMSDPELSQAQLEAIKGIGVSIALDDFGTGYSSLSYLASLPVDRIKIDRSFVNDIQFTNQSKAIIESIIHLGIIMGKIVIAEGVEEKEQLSLLQSLGCHEVQGYYISKPITADEFIHFLNNKE
ncbi:EAL domain-containing protein [Neptuniibacter sp. PT8_73]|uniref:EAL domain-containing protein n=1 Tax=Neptuniibacter sp. PT8_73 TaxID=3398206 RepID=UPI0039F450A1